MRDLTGTHLPNHSGVKRWPIVHRHPVAVKVLGHANDFEGLTAEDPLLPCDLSEAEPAEGGLRSQGNNGPQLEEDGVPSYLLDRRVQAPSDTLPACAGVDEELIDLVPSRLAALLTCGKKSRLSSNHMTFPLHSVTARADGPNCSW